MQRAVVSAVRFMIRAEKNGIHGLNYDIRDGIKKVPYYSKCTTGRHLTFRVTLLTSFTEIDTSDACFTLLRGGNK